MEDKCSRCGSGSYELKSKKKLSDNTNLMVEIRICLDCDNKYRVIYE